MLCYSLDRACSSIRFRTFKCGRLAQSGWLHDVEMQSVPPRIDFVEPLEPHRLVTPARCLTAMVRIDMVSQRAWSLSVSSSLCLASTRCCGIPWLVATQGLRLEQTSSDRRLGLGTVERQKSQTVPVLACTRAPFDFLEPCSC